MRNFVNLGVCFIIIMAFVYAIYEKQKIINEGQIVYLKLAPVDPRSLMQGDYMRLRYDIETKSKINENSGFIQLGLDEKRVGYLMTYFEQNKIKPVTKIMFKYNKAGSRMNIEPSSFLFQQGLRKLYAQAKYGVFKVSDKQHLLVGLADGDLRHIKPPIDTN